MKSLMTVVTGVVTTTVATTLLATPSFAAPTTTTTDKTTQVQSAAQAKAAKKAAAAKKLAAKKAAAKKKKLAIKKKKLAAKRKAIARKKARIRMKKRTLPARALKIARKKRGAPYRWGATGPHAFDCSGLTGWAYRKAGKKLPRTSRSQAAVAKRTKKPRKGDLVFFHRGGRVYHVGLYAGKGKVFHAARTGVPVKQERIWTRSVFYGRAV